MQDRYHFLIGLVLLLTIVAVLFFILFSQIVNQTMVKPINHLSKAAVLYVTDREKMSNGEKIAIELLNIHTGDEIELLADSMKQMEKDLSHYIDHFERLEYEFPSLEEIEKMPSDIKQHAQKQVENTVEKEIYETAFTEIPRIKESLTIAKEKKQELKSEIEMAKIEHYGKSLGNKKILN